MLKTYEELFKLVNAGLKYYKTDLHVNDKETLSKYHGKFIYGYRFSGTNMIKMDINLIDYSKKREKFEIERIFLENNDNFLYFNGEKLLCVSQNEAIKLFEKFTNSLNTRYELIEKLDIPAISLKLLSLMENRNWKSLIGSSTVPEIRRLRNYFNFQKLKKTKSQDVLIEQLYKLLDV